MLSVPPLGMLDCMRSVDNGRRWPGQGCWLGSRGMLFFGSRRSLPLIEDSGFVDACAPGSLMRCPYTLYMAELRYSGGTGHALAWDAWSITGQASGEGAAAGGMLLCLFPMLMCVQCCPTSRAGPGLAGQDGHYSGTPLDRLSASHKATCRGVEGRLSRVLQLPSRSDTRTLTERRRMQPTRPHPRAELQRCGSRSLPSPADPPPS